MDVGDEQVSVTRIRATIEADIPNAQPDLTQQPDPRAKQQLRHGAEQLVGDVRHGLVVARQRQQDHDAEAEGERLEELDAVEEVSEASQLLRLVMDTGFKHLGGSAWELGSKRVLVDYHTNLQTKEHDR